MKQPVLTTRDHLLDIGLRLAKENGLCAVTVRGVAKEAGVNLGSFVYHFKNRENFITLLMEVWYHPLIDNLEITTRNDFSPIENIYSMIDQVTRFLIDHRTFISLLAKDILLGETALQGFVQTTIPRHIYLVIKMIKNAQEQRQIIQDSPTEIFMFIASAVGVPIIIQQLFLQNVALKKPIASDEARQLRDQFIQFSLDPIAIRKRAQWALKAIAVETI